MRGRGCFLPSQTTATEVEGAKGFRKVQFWRSLETTETSLICASEAFHEAETSNPPWDDRKGVCEYRCVMGGRHGGVWVAS